MTEALACFVSAAHHGQDGKQGPPMGGVRVGFDDNEIEREKGCVGE